jgi:hypothetical protein
MNKSQIAELLMKNKNLVNNEINTFGITSPNSTFTTNMKYGYSPPVNKISQPEYFSKNNSYMNSYNMFPSGKNSPTSLNNCEGEMNNLLNKPNLNFYNNNNNNSNNISLHEENNSYSRKKIIKTGTANEKVANSLNNFENRILEMRSKLKKDNNSSNYNQTNSNFQMEKERFINNNSINDYNSNTDSKYFNTESNDRNYENKSNHFILSSKFFKDCKILLKEDQFEQLICIFSNRVNEDYDRDKIESLLISYPKLIKDFRMIFPNNDNNN